MYERLRNIDRSRADDRSVVTSGGPAPSSTTYLVDGLGDRFLTGDGDFLIYVEPGK